MSVSAYPLCWPPGWKRTASPTSARFTRYGKAISVFDGVERVLAELSRFNIPRSLIVISTNVPTRLDGTPRGDRPEPRDSGAAVYWGTKKGEQRCMAIDRYERVADNLAAIAATLDAMRAIERHGGATILDRAFSGFAQLAAPEQPFQVLGVGAHASKEEIERAYRLLASKHHPDKGGDPNEMARINAARDAML